MQCSAGQRHGAFCIQKINCSNKYELLVFRRKCELLVVHKHRVFRQAVRLTHLLRENSRALNLWGIHTSPQFRYLT